MKKYCKKIMMSAPEDLYSEICTLKQQESPHLTQADLFRLLIITGLGTNEKKGINKNG